MRTHPSLVALLVVLSLGASGFAAAQTPASSPLTTPALNLYAVEIKTGPGWDAAKPPQEQLHFREHSANLKRLRDAGQLVLGARYADKGLVVLQAASAEAAHAMMRQDPAIQGQVFTYALHDFNVFYGGAVQTKRRSP
ncbi:YciI family protein [Roseateles toxinivorans]|uniref:YCII-related domain-containing protein n=1 Tax=Roseateles toxinivorans TaxID=270368 RepID=A0A4R6QT88_9BURK|nr:YciI family protein [Roseateles toxinivorans]TDP74283.1 YCII-related domain-containing protein [Roseateles toxinivorans]